MERCKSAICPCCLEEMGVFFSWLFFPLAHLQKLIFLVSVDGRGRECFPILSHCSFPVKTWQVSLVNHHWLTSSFHTINTRSFHFLSYLPAWEESDGNHWCKAFYLPSDTVLRKKGERERIPPCGCLPDTWDKVVKLTLELMALVKVKKNFEIYRAQWLLISIWTYDSARKAKELCYWYLH